MECTFFLTQALYSNHLLLLPAWPFYRTGGYANVEKAVSLVCEME